MRVLTGVGEKLGGNKPGVKCLTWIDARLARIIDRQVDLSLQANRADHLGNLLQEISEVYSIAAVGGQPQGLVELRHTRNARTDFVEQFANLIRRKGFAAVGNSVALNANNAIQAGQVVCYPMIGLSRPNNRTFDQD